MHRRVRKLRLTAGRDTDAQHGRVLLEDALRTASFGDESRLVLVRRLALGELPARASATEWSRRIEERFQDARTGAVHASDARAPTAAAVFFHHRFEPFLLLAEHAAAGGKPDAWFWPIAAKGWSHRQTPSETLRFCFTFLAREGGLGPTLTLGLRVTARGTATVLRLALRPEDFASLGRDLGRAEVAQPEEIESRWWEITSTAHAIGLDPMSLLVGSPAPFLRETLLRIDSPALSPPPLDPIVLPPRPTASNRPPVHLEQIPTQAGGLFFTLRLLEREGFVRHLESLPEDQRTLLPLQVLNVFLRHARTRPHDPMRRLFQGVPSARVPLAGWLRVAHRRARTLTALSLREVMVRPAMVTLTPTHIDVHFRAGDADLRIRRAGLDIDPGWVPWLGRVVTFHYNRST